MSTNRTTTPVRRLASDQGVLPCNTSICLAAVAEVEVVRRSTQLQTLYNWSNNTKGHTSIPFHLCLASLGSFSTCKHSQPQTHPTPRLCEHRSRPEQI
eukprot:632460-Hanusia_phi.AAC.2